MLRRVSANMPSKEEQSFSHWDKPFPSCRLHTGITSHAARPPRDHRDAANILVGFHKADLKSQSDYSHGAFA